MSTRARIKALEAKHPGAADNHPMNMTDTQLARAAGAPWLLSCTDAELLEIAQGIHASNPVRYAEIETLAKARSAKY